MPKAAPRPCTFPGCSALVQGASRCPLHPHETTFASRTRGTRQARGYGSFWDRLRAQVLARDSHLCQQCLREGILTSARTVDHKVNKAERGTDDPSNLEAICDEHHKVKTQSESRRGRGRRL
jgi:5-methylcytosine-specific restriction protein A